MHLFTTDAEIETLLRETVPAAEGKEAIAVSSTVPAGYHRPEDCVCLYDLDTVSVEWEDVDLPGNLLLATVNTFSSAADVRRALVLWKPLSRARLEVALQFGREAQLNTAADELEAQLVRLVRFQLQLQTVEQRWNQFFDRAVQELRAPLTSLTGYCTLLLERRLGTISEQQETAIARMQRTLTRLSAIVSAMQLFGQGQSDAELPPMKENGFTECIEQAVRQVTPLIMQRRMEVSVDLAPCGGTIRADARQMEEVFVNLLDNSCKYTPRGGMVRVSGYPYRDGKPQTRQGYRVDIADSGPVIQPELLNRIFDEGYGLSEASSERAGNGLSLAICNLIVKRHHGWLWAESSTDGTTFSIVLPTN